jgi:hypothetical protein
LFAISLKGGSTVVVMAVPPPMPHVGVAISPPGLVASGIGIARSLVLAIGIRIELGAIARLGDHLLRFRGHYQRRCGESRGA